MHLFAILLLGHLIADFPLQMDWIFQLKHRHWAGILLHSVIHSVLTAILIEAPLTHWPMLVSLGLIHFAIDWLKLRMRFRFQSPGFILDQIAHILSLLLLATWPPVIAGALPPAPLYPALAYALVPALLTFFSVLTSDLEQLSSVPSRSKNTAVKSALLVLSRAAGLPLVIVIVLTRLGDSM